MLRKFRRVALRTFHRRGIALIRWRLFIISARFRLCPWKLQSHRMSRASETLKCQRESMNAKILQARYPMFRMLISIPSSKVPNIKINKSTSSRKAEVARFRPHRALPTRQRAVWKIIIDRRNCSKKRMLKCSLRNQPNILDSHQNHHSQRRRQLQLLRENTSQAQTCWLKSKLPRELLREINSIHKIRVQMHHHNS